jgi:hypothetical protein
MIKDSWSPSHAHWWQLDAHQSPRLSKHGSVDCLHWPSQPATDAHCTHQCISRERNSGSTMYIRQVLKYWIDSLISTWCSSHFPYTPTKFTKLTRKYNHCMWHSLKTLLLKQFKPLASKTLWFSSISGSKYPQTELIPKPQEPIFCTVSIAT